MATSFSKHFPALNHIDTSYLQVLNLLGNSLSKMRGISSLRALQHLTVSFNEFTRLDDICRMVKVAKTNIELKLNNASKCIRKEPIIKQSRIVSVNSPALSFWTLAIIA